MNQPLSGETPDLDEPKYKLQFSSRHLSGEKEVSTAQVQFWQDYAEDFVESFSENTSRSQSLPVNLLRVDLLTNEYHPQHVQRLDTEGHGPLMRKSLDVLT